MAFTRTKLRISVAGVCNPNTDRDPDAQFERIRVTTGCAFLVRY